MELLPSARTIRTACSLSAGWTSTPPRRPQAGRGDDDAVRIGLLLARRGPARAGRKRISNQLHALLTEMVEESAKADLAPQASKLLARCWPTTVVGSPKASPRLATAVGATCSRPPPPQAPAFCGDRATSVPTSESRETSCASSVMVRFSVPAGRWGMTM